MSEMLILKYYYRKGGKPMKKTWGKRLLSGITSALLAAAVFTNAIPLEKVGLLDANALTASDGVEIVSDEAEKVRLLVGESATSPLSSAKTVSEANSKANSTYLLGIASQFGVFIEGDFSDLSADVESRLAVGGGANIGDITAQSGFEVGNGDFISKVALEYLVGATGFAHAIVQGNSKEYPYFQNIITESWDDYKNVDGGEGTGKLSKTFVIGDNIDLSDTTNNFSVNIAKEHIPYDTSAFRKVDAPLIDFPSAFTELRSRSAVLASQKSEGTEIVFSNGSKSLIYEDYKNSIVEPSAVDEGKRWDGNMAHLRYEGGDTDVVKFNLTEEEWNAITKCAYVSYEDIPEDANIIVSVAGTNIKVVPEYQFSFINGTQITTGDAKGIAGSNGVNPGNNDYHCEKLLYNFYEAETLNIRNNFAGNIFSPNADVTGENNGHLSGALVAKSFSGNFEFGYRPYQGGYGLLGVESNYSIDLYKYITGTDELLDGATFGFFPVDDEGNVSENPSKEVVVDNGHINYPITPGKYALKETKAPDGYDIDTEKVVYFEVVESGKTKTSLNTGSVFPENADVYTIGVDGFTQEMADSGEYTPA